MANALPLCDNVIWAQYISRLRHAGCEHFLSSVCKEGAQRMVSVQLKHTNGNVDASVTNAIQAIKEMEAATVELQEHERLMDKDYFEYLLKSNLFMTSGRDREHGRPITWLREGLKGKELWKLQYGTPKAHAYIRHHFYQSQVARARLLAEKEFSPTLGAAGLVVVDMVLTSSFLSRFYRVEAFEKHALSSATTTVAGLITLRTI